MNLQINVCQSCSTFILFTTNSAKDVHKHHGSQPAFGHSSRAKYHVLQPHEMFIHHSIGSDSNTAKHHDLQPNAMFIHNSTSNDSNRPKQSMHSTVRSSNSESNDSNRPQHHGLQPSAMFIHNSTSNDSNRLTQSMYSTYSSSNSNARKDYAAATRPTIPTVQ